MRVRDDLGDLEGYHSPQVDVAIRLNTNESPYPLPESFSRDLVDRVAKIGLNRYPDGAAHGSGCTHSSALAAWLARGASPLEAARRAKELASEAIARGLRDVGTGAGPVDALGLVARRVA